MEIELAERSITVIDWPYRSRPHRSVTYPEDKAAYLEDKVTYLEDNLAYYETCRANL